METVNERFAAGAGARWQRFVVGAGALEPTGSTLRFSLDGANSKRYSNAQIDDYQGLPRRHFVWRPPLKLRVRARFSDPARLQGTAGFGFWNDPFLMTGKRLPTLPQAAWFFFASAPSDMKLDLETPGRGWKAATIDAARPAALALAPTAPLAVLMMNLKPVYRRLWPPIQQALHIGEAELGADMAQWHTYVLEWGQNKCHFSLAGCPEAVLEAPSPRGPLGFVMWLDNQFLAVTPWGRLRWGLLNVPDRQWMEVDELEIEPL
jgi:hypothetical protein